MLEFSRITNIMIESKPTARTLERNVEGRFQARPQGSFPWALVCEPAWLTTPLPIELVLFPLRLSELSGRCISCVVIATHTSAAASLLRGETGPLMSWHFWRVFPYVCNAA